MQICSNFPSSLSLIGWRRSAFQRDIICKTVKSGRSVGRLWRELILLYIWGGQQFVLAKYVQHCYLLPEEDVEPNRALLPVGCLSAPAGKTVYDFISGPFHSRCRRAPPPPPFPCCLFTSGPGAGLKNLNAEYIWRGKLIITRRQGWTKRDVVAGWLAIASSAGGWCVFIGRGSVKLLRTSRWPNST